MAEEAETPIVERRKVIIEYEVNGPAWSKPPSINFSIEDVAALAAQMVRKAAGKNRPL